LVIFANLYHIVGVDIVITIDAKLIDRTILTKGYPTRFYAKHFFAFYIIVGVYHLIARMALNAPA